MCSLGWSPPEMTCTENNITKKLAGRPGLKASCLTRRLSHLCAVSSEQIDAPLLPPEPMAEPKSVRLGFVTGLVAVDKLQVRLLVLGTAQHLLT